MDTAKLANIFEEMLDLIATRIIEPWALVNTDNEPDLANAPAPAK